MKLNHSSVKQLREQFPALSKEVNGQRAVFFDGPAGTQVPQRVIDAVGDYFINHNANHEGVFATSRESDALLQKAHRAAADLIGTDDEDTISFGANMTSLTFALSRAISRDWNPGDEIVVSRLEHDANFTPWILAAKDRGVTVRMIDVDPSDCTLRLDQYQSALSDKTKLVAVGCASNAVGTVNPVQQICRWASEVGALSFLDAVHYAPHALMDVEQWQCDFLACSAYKFFGPHVGILYGRRPLLESIQPYKLRTAPDSVPGRWMTGTQNHECIAGTLAAIEYLASLGHSDQSTQVGHQRERLSNAMGQIRAYEQTLLHQLMQGLRDRDEIKVWGITDPDQFDHRLPTLSITHPRFSPQQLAEKLAEAGIFVWHGNYYALPLTEAIGVEPEGMVRIGLCHYNTADEVARLLETLDQISASV